MSRITVERGGVLSGRRQKGVAVAVEFGAADAVSLCMHGASGMRLSGVHRLRAGLSRRQAHLDREVERLGDPAEHAQGVPVVLGVLEVGDHRLRGPDPLSELGLGQTRRLADGVDLLAYGHVLLDPLDLGPAVGAVAEAVTQDFNSVRGGAFPGLAHGRSPL